ncbi:MAG: branched-chain amino acid ABC transporter permease [Thermodesulforhabdaceae bacterium]
MEWVQYAVSGVTVGMIYVLVALGYNIIYNVTEVINFAQGEFVMLGGLFAVFYHETLHLPLWIAFFMSVATVGIVGLLFEKLAVRHARSQSILTLIIVTIAFSIILKGSAMFIWGKDPYSLPAFSLGPSWMIAGAAVQRQSLWIVGISLLIITGLSIFFHRSYYGKAMCACADNPIAARMMGIPVRRMILLSFTLSAALGAAGGVIITPLSLMEYDRGALLGLKGFSVAVLGGLGNFWGAFVAGIFIGIAESFCAGYLSSGYKDAVALIALLLVLFVKPEGLFGKGK